MYAQSMFSAKIRKINTIFHPKVIVYTAVKNCSILYRSVIVMDVFQFTLLSNSDSAFIFIIEIFFFLLRVSCVLKLKFVWKIPKKKKKKTLMYMTILLFGICVIHRNMC